uniref:SUN domain-containing ossification factor n=1 Tax=Cacopsylla melanoneura TaxID=428564 RepID=A0A8D9DUP6_9HEMI
MNVKAVYLSLLCFLLICNKSLPKQLNEEEELVSMNGTKAAFSLSYLTKEFKVNKPKETPIMNEENILQTTETLVTSIPHLLNTNGVVSNNGLSDTGQVPVVVTLANSAPSSSDLVNNAASNSLHIDLERIKNNTRRLLSTLEADLAQLNQTLQSDGEVESTHLPHLSTLAPPGGDNETSGPGPSTGLPQQKGSKVNDTGGVPASPGLVVQTPSAEDIPSFREWTQKQLAEAEKKKGENLTVLTPVTMKHKKIRSKNYASLDCGAKIVGANPEAKSPNSVLSPSRDEYILSPCTSKIWFAVELCESIQAKKIELANFELFSSSPREFTVSVSDRWTSKDWTVVGQFVARDERTVQSFPLSHSLFAKYVKLEFHSHYGAEHFCPVSLLRVFGTSELDVLDSDAQDGRGEDEGEEEEDEGEEEEEGGGGGGETKLERRKKIKKYVGERRRRKIRSEVEQCGEEKEKEEEQDEEQIEEELRGGGGGYEEEAEEEDMTRRTRMMKRRRRRRRRLMMMNG